MYLCDCVFDWGIGEGFMDNQITFVFLCDCELDREVEGAFLAN